MKRKKPSIIKLAGKAAFFAGATVLRQCFEKREKAHVNRDMDEKALSKRLSLVNIVYHAIGVFYNE